MCFAHLVKWSGRLQESRLSCSKRTGPRALVRGQRPVLGQCLSTSGTIPHSAVVHGRVPVTKKDASSTQSLPRLNVGMWPSKYLEYAERKVNFGAFSKSFGILPV